MVALRSRRLETLFGSSLDRVTADHVESLVASATQESFDLDYKRDLYGTTDAERRKLAGDVAALANTAGGVIVLGIEEDNHARAIRAPGVAISDAEVARIRQIVASLVAPVPVFDVIPISSENGSQSGAMSHPGHGYIAIAVPQSPLAPHAVLVNDALRFPRRNGSTTRYLSESEVASAYRDRFSSHGAQLDRIEETEKDIISRLDISELSWLVVSLAPDLPGDFVISQKAYREFREEILSTSIGLFNSASYVRAWTGSRRFLADASLQEEGTLARWGALEVRRDGGGAYAIAVARVSDRREPWAEAAVASNEAPPLVQVVDDESVILGIVSGLLRLAQHASDRAGVGGGVLVRTQLLPVSRERPTKINHYRSGFSSYRSSHVAVKPPRPAETSARVEDLYTAGPDLIAVACRLGDELGQSLGVPEMGQLSENGEVRIKYWGLDIRARLVKWAESNNIIVTDDTLDS